MNPVTRFLAQTVQPPSINVPSVDSTLIYKIIAAVILMLVGIAFWKTTIGKVLIVAVVVYIVLKVSGHIA